MTTTKEQPKSKVIAQISISCGCGFRALKGFTDAQLHAQTTGHCLTVQGVVGPQRKIMGVRVV
jgi:hypothetical protein